MTASSDNTWTFDPGNALGAEQFKDRAKYQARMLDTMKDTVSEYMDEANGEKLIFSHLEGAALDALLYHQGMVDKIQTVLDRLELSS